MGAEQSRGRCVAVSGHAPAWSLAGLRARLRARLVRGKGGLPCAQKRSPERGRGAKARGRWVADSARTQRTQDRRQTAEAPRKRKKQDDIVPRQFPGNNVFLPAFRDSGLGLALRGEGAHSASAGRDEGTASGEGCARQKCVATQGRRVESQPARKRRIIAVML